MSLNVTDNTDAAHYPARALITDNIDVWTSAIKKRNSQGRGSSKKIELTGVKKLRELILELAVRGKLVPQDASDEPASVLLERIAEEKAQLIADKKIKKQKPLPSINDEEKPFELPNGWEWVSFGDICEIERGGSPRPIKSFITDDADGLNWIKIGDTDIGGKYITSTAEKIIKEGLKKTRVVYPGDFLLTNSMSFGRPYITKIQGCIHDGWLRICPPNTLDKDYLYSLLSSPFIIRAFKKSASGAVVMNLNAEKVRAVTIAIPPINEQHRIVAKVDELMTLCDQLEQQTEQSLTAHQTLVEVLLAALLPSTSKSADGSSDSTDDFKTSWQRIAEHFDLLFTTELSIEQLKQTILQLAVMGKLVPQNPSDEPASVLLEKIAEEKAQLIVDKKIKKQKPLPAITDEEKRFELPNGWGLTRLDDICLGITSGSTPPKDKFNETTGVPYLKVYNIKEQAIAFDYRPQFVDVQHHKDKLTRSILYPGDVVMNIVGPPLGKIAIIPDDYPEWNCNQAIVFFRPIEASLNGYIYTYLTSGKFLDSIELIGTAGQDNISVTKSRSIIFPMPPVEEQHRIVAKVDELMALCVQLKARLSDAQTTQLHLADAVVENALLTTN
ncbi:MAG: type I restriction enzyme S subunit [Alteromonadaceae bacterium]|jgi:type I restriction enzyme S subunit